MKTPHSSKFFRCRRHGSSHVYTGGGIFQTTAVLAALVLASTGAAYCGVIDDVKFKLDIRGDANENAYIDAGEVGNALDFSAAAHDSVRYGGGNATSSITAKNYASYGTAKYGTMPYISSSVTVTSPYDGSASSRPCIVMPQESKTENDSTSWAEYGVVMPASAVPPGPDGYVTIYSRFKWDGNTSNPNILVGNCWNGLYNNSENGISVYIRNDRKIGILNNQAMPYCSLNVSEGVWYDLFVTAHNETIGGVEKAVANLYLYKANSGKSLTLATSSITNNAMGFSTNRLVIGCFNNNSTGWHNPDKNGPRAFRGAIADVMLWDRAITRAEMEEVMAGTQEGGEWQIGAINGNADEFDDTEPAAIFEPQTMPWNRMRKTLDSSNTSLSIAVTMLSSEHQMARTLTFTPILSGASAPVEVALNGTTVGEIDLATETSITLPKALWRHDGTENTITITHSNPSIESIRFDAISLTPDPSATSVLEDASFKLDLRGGNSTFTQPGDLGDALTFSSASPIIGYMGDQRGPQTYNSNHGTLPAQEMDDVPNPYYPYTTNTQNVLHFYQNSKTDTSSALTSVVFPGAAPQGPVQTFYIRFRWDGRIPGLTDTPSYIFQSGNAENGWKEAGVGLYIDENSENSTTNLGMRGSLISGGFANLKISAGEWNDVFITFEQNDDNTGYTATATLCKPKPNGLEFSPPSLTTQSRKMNLPLSFNSRNLTIGGYYDSSTSTSATRGFRGLVANFIIWDRSLTDEEKIEVMAGQHGAKWMIGAKNGSADEFSDTAPVAVFEPQSMPWRMMRKTLDAETPALTLKSPLPSFEAGKPMILHIDPIFSGTASSVPISVAVNGETIGSLDLAEKRNFLIERHKWQRDGSGNVTVTLTRTETTGAVAIDAISISGSWQIQDANGIRLLNEQYAPNHYFAGDPMPNHIGNSFSRGKSHIVYTFGVWVPSGLDAGYSWKFLTRTTSAYDKVQPANRRFTLSVNGSLLTTIEGTEMYSIEIPEGVLRPGMNMVEFRQTAPTSGTDWTYYSPWSMILIPPPKSFIMLVR